MQGDRISLDRQLLNHVTTISRISALQSNKTFTAEYLKKCIYLSNIGSNDYINNYLIPNNYPTSNTYTVDQYATVLVQQYSQQLKTLYNLGARKIAVFGLGQVGCAPAEIAMLALMENHVLSGLMMQLCYSMTGLSILLRS